VLAAGRDESWRFLSRLGNGTVEAVSISEVDPSASGTPSSSAARNATSSSSTTTAAGSTRGGDGALAIAVPVVAAVVGALLLAVLLCLCAVFTARWHRRRKGRVVEEEQGVLPAVCGCGRPMEHVLPLPEEGLEPVDGLEVCPGEEFGASGATARDSRASTVAPRQQQREFTWSICVWGEWANVDRG
jgi:hypothetical protein